MRVSKVFLCGLLALVYSAGQARADLVTPVSVTPSTEFAAAVNLINGSGLDGVGPVADQLHDNDEDFMWQSWGGFGEASGTSIGANVTFELDQVYDLSGAHIWQYNGAIDQDLNDPNNALVTVLSRQVNDFDISISPDLVSPFVSLGTNSLAPALDPLAGPVTGPPGGTYNEPAQTFGLGAGNLARRVKITILSIYDPNGTQVLNDPNGVPVPLPDGFSGLSEVRFEGTVIPEPATLGLAALSALSLPWLVRRRRRNRS